MDKVSIAINCIVTDDEEEQIINKEFFMADDEANWELIFTYHDNTVMGHVSNKPASLVGIVFFLNGDDVTLFDAESWKKIQKQYCEVVDDLYNRGLVTEFFTQSKLVINDTMPNLYSIVCYGGVNYPHPPLTLTISADNENIYKANMSERGINWDEIDPEEG